MNGKHLAAETLPTFRSSVAVTMVRENRNFATREKRDCRIALPQLATDAGVTNADFFFSTEISGRDLLMAKTIATLPDRCLPWALPYRTTPGVGLLVHSTSKEYATS